MDTIGVRDLANRASAVLDELEQGGRSVMVTRRGRPVAVLSAIDADEFYDYVLARSPEFVAGREAAEARFARGEYGVSLDDVIVETRRRGGGNGGCLRFGSVARRKRI